VKEFLQARDISDPLCYYRFGIIDFLQDYTKKKKLETFYLRRRFSKKDPNCFSCVDPAIYADRFHDFLAGNLFLNTRKFPESERQLSDKERRTQGTIGGSAGRIGEEPASRISSKSADSGGGKWQWLKFNGKGSSTGKSGGKTVRPSGDQ
jgi:hypothetical protein